MNENEFKEWCSAADAIDRSISEILTNNRLNMKLKSLCDVDDSFYNFLQHILYVLTEFLKRKNNEEGCDSLFLRIPVNEVAPLGDDDSLQRKRYAILNEVICYSLQIATSKHFRETVRIENAPDTRDDFVLSYKKDDCFYVKGDGDEDLFCKVEEKEDDDRQKITTLIFYKIINRGGSCKLIKCTNGKHLYSTCKKNTLTKLKAWPNRNIEGVVTSIKHDLKNTQWLLDTSFFTNYKKACLCTSSTYMPKDSMIGVDTKYVVSNLYVSNNSKDDIFRKADIIAVCGDRVYKRVLQNFINKHPRKLIVVGSDIPQGFNPLKIYSFTYREMYRYCCPTWVNPLIEPIVHIFDFPWLKKVKIDFDVFLESLRQEDENFHENSCRRICNSFIAFCTGESFDSGELAEIKSIFNFEKIRDMVDLDTSIETIEKILGWIDKLEYNEVNPKRQWKAQQQNEVQVFPRYKQLNNISKKLKGSENILCVDSLSYYKHKDLDGDERIKQILRNSWATRIVSLYYKDFEDNKHSLLMNFINKEKDVYKSETRKDYKTTFEINYENPVATSVEFGLEDYYDVDRYHYERGYYESDRYLVTFKDNSKDVVVGDILVKNNRGYDRIHIEDLEFRNDSAELIIKYYKSVHPLEEKNLDESEIVMYANLWKDKFIELFEEYKCEIENESHNRVLLNDIYKKLKLDSGLRDETIKYYHRQTKNKFIQNSKEMEVMCNFLTNQSKITDLDRRKILGARIKYYGTSIQAGIKLKDALLNRELKKKYDSDIIDDAAFLAGMDINEYVNRCFVEKEVIKVEIL